MKKNIRNNKIFLFAKRFVKNHLFIFLSFVFCSQLSAQTNITGKVSSGDSALADVSVTLKGASQGARTDANGEFNINAPANGTLVFSHSEFRSSEVKIKGRSLINVTLTSVASTLGEVVVVGYGTQKKVNLTGSISTVSSSELLKRQSSNVGDLLEGKVPGLQVVQPSGEPGADDPTLRIRGLGTFSSAGSDPLVLIDGVQRGLNQINPADIESITVLKDAASASIYGSRAANGVILVTSKRGQAGKLNIQYDGNYQGQKPTRMPDLVTNSADFMTYVNMANERDNLVDYYSQAQIDGFRDSSSINPIKYPNFNWMKYMLTNGSEQNHHISMSGGNEKTTFNVGLGSTDQDGIIIHNAYTFKKYNLMVNIDSKLNRVVSFGANVFANYSEKNNPVMSSDEDIMLAYSAGPNYLPKLSDGSGLWTWRYNNADWHNRNPEQALAYGSEKTQVYSFSAQTFMDVNLTRDLVFEVKGAVSTDVTFFKHHEVQLASYFYSDNSLAALSTGYNPGVTDQFQQNTLTTLYSTLNYNKSFGKHNVHGLLGTSTESNNYRYLQGSKLTFPTADLAELNAGSSENQTLNGSSNAWALESYFGRVNYSFDGKYLLESNFRYDGSSRLAMETRWGLFPSISAGWLINKESFMEGLTSIDNLKLRASWGKLGNQNIGNYPYQDILQTNAYPFNSSVSQGAAVTSLTDKNITWETTTVKDLGLDLDVKNGLFSLTADYFNKITDNILYNAAIPASVGLSSPTVNGGKMGNKGIELAVGHSNYIGRLKYSVNLNFSTFKNTVLSINAPDIGSTTIIQKGLPWNTFYLTQAVGIFQSQDDINKSPMQPYNPKPGDLKFKDQNGDGVIDAKDIVPVKGAFPKFYYGGSINLSWKNFDLNAFMQGVEGQKIYLSNWGVDPFTQGSPPTKDFVKNMWTPDNHSNTTPAMYRSGYGPVDGTPSTYFLKDASYFRLKNLMIGYTLPASVIGKIGMKNLRVYVSGDNLATITKYPGADPEWLGGGYGFATFPQLKSYTFGLTVKF
jgi:TonB-linked SusC/RagA family outer membrane protein